MKNFLVALALLILLLSGGPAVESAPTQIVPDEVFTGHEMVEDWRIKEADAYSSDLMRKYPDSGDAVFLRARVEFLQGNYDYAWKLLKQVDDTRREVRDFKSLVGETRKATAHFITRETEHFIFRFVEGPDAILIPYAQEVLEQSYQVLGDLFEYHPSEKIRVEFYPDRKPLSRVSPLTLQDIITSGTVALCKYNRIMMISPASLVRGYNWMDTLSHEYVHFLLTKKSNNHLPLWLHEGIAKHFETRWREGSDFLTPIMETILAAGLDNDYLIPLESMMPSLAKLKTAEDVQLAYAEVSTMVDFLVTRNGEQIIPALLTELASGTSFETALENRTGADLQTFQEKWKQYVKQKELKRIPGLKALQTRFKKNRGEEDEKKEYTEVGTQRAQDLTFLGDILKSRNLYHAAILEYEKALDETESHSPILYNKLSGTYLMTRKYEEAETLLKKILGYYPHFPTTLTHLGELYLATERYDQARVYYERAVRINPFNPFAHLRLIEIYKKLGMAEEKKLQAELLGLLQ